MEKYFTLTLILCICAVEGTTFSFLLSWFGTEETEESSGEGSGEVPDYSAGVQNLTNITINPPVLDAISWYDAEIKALQLLQMMIPFSGGSQMAMEDVSNETDDSQLLSNNSMDSDASKVASPEKRQSFGCFGGDVCLTCLQYIVLPNGYPTCCYRCSTNPRLYSEGEEFTCNCDYFS